MLQTNESWEYLQRGQILGALFNQPGLRQYPCVEIAVNVALFHVDIIFRDKHQEWQSWSRYIFTELPDVLRSIAGDGVVKVRVSLQTRRSDNDEYIISSIDEIVEGIDREGRKHLVFKCSNNENYIDSFFEESENDLSEKRTIWPR